MDGGGCARAQAPERLTAPVPPAHGGGSPARHEQPDMTQPEPTISDEIRAVRTLDVFYSMELGCSSRDLHRPGWTLLPANADCDPMALLFGQRPLLHLVAPMERDGAPRAGGVVSVAPELRAAVATLLRGHTPATLFTPESLRSVDALMRSSGQATASITPLREAHQTISYVTASQFRPYVGQWQEWIEPLDESEETDLMALGLLARYSGGVYVVRQHRDIAAYSGIRSHSPHVAEVSVRTQIEALRGHGLGRAVFSRATRAVFAAGRLPLYRYRAGHVAGERIAESLGYRPYADTLAYFTVSS